MPAPRPPGVPPRHGGDPIENPNLRLLVRPKVDVRARAEEGMARNRELLEKVQALQRRYARAGAREVREASPGR